MLTLIAAALLAQQAKFDAMEYVRAHRDADAALVAGKLSEARMGFERCLAMSPSNATVAYALACTETRAENAAKALEWFERAIEWGYADADVAQWDADLAGLRDENTFKDLLSRLRPLLKDVAPSNRPVLIWDEWNRDPMARDMSVDPAGEVVIVARRDGRLQVLEAKSGEALRNSPTLTAEAVCLAFDNKGKRVFALTRSGKLQSWGIAGDSPPRSVGETLANIRDVPLEDSLLKFDPSGERLLVVPGRESGTILVAADGGVLHAWEVSFGFGDEPLVEWSPDGSRIAWCQREMVQFAAGETGEPAELPLTTPAPIGCLAYSPGGAFLATGHDDKRVRIWNLHSRELTHEHRFSDAAGVGDHWYVEAVAYSPDGRWLAAGVGDGGGIEVFDASTHVLVRSFDCAGRGYGTTPRELRWGLDSKRLWFKYCGIGHGVDNIVLSSQLPESFSYRGHSSRVAKSGLAVALGESRHGQGMVFGIEARTGRCLWSRPDLGRPGEILQTAAGYFLGDFREFDGLFVEQNSEQHPLADLAVRLFDPNRVRAAREGVEIVTVKF